MPARNGKPRGNLRPLEFADGIALARPADRERLLNAIVSAGAVIYNIAGVKFIDQADWQRALRRLAVEVGHGS